MKARKEAFERRRVWLEDNIDTKGALRKGGK